MNLFDVLGPVMIGPSSSHTAGAVRLGRLARLVLGEKAAHAMIGLHGSFAQTHKGHGPDVALVAGLLDWNPDDARIPDSFRYAKEAGLDFSFQLIDLGEQAHPNTARLELTGLSGQRSCVTGCSIGGGRVQITDIDGFALEMGGELPTLLVVHPDRPGAISQVTTVLFEHNVNIAAMRVSRQQKGSTALMVLETDQPINDNVLHALSALSLVDAVRRIDPLS